MIRLPLIMVFILAVIASPALALPRLFHKSAPKAPIDNAPLRLRHIAGVVVDKKGLFIPYPAVELRDGNDHHVIATSFADGNGRFHFEDRKPGEVLEIRFALKGFQPAEYTIDVVRIGHSTMKAVMASSQ